MDDSGIIELYFRRAETAIEETARKYGTYLNSVAYRILNSREDAEEIVGDTYSEDLERDPADETAGAEAFPDPYHTQSVL